jgi:hypothetical protein
LQNESCLQNETDPLENHEQAEGIESIENDFIDNQMVFPSKPLHLQSSTIMEGYLIVGQGVCPSSSNSFSNQSLNSIIEEHTCNENDLECSNILIKQVRDINLQLEEETLNLHPQIIPYSQKD